MRSLLAPKLAAAFTTLLALAAACGPAPAPAPPTAGTAAPRPPAKEVDICDGSKPSPRVYAGILRNVRCDQDRFITMASVADQLGVECKHCHATVPGDATKEDYPVMTPKKDIANWMSTHLMQAVKPADGSPMRCKACHTDENGKPVTKILGNPRDPVKANEWMSLVMVNKFVAADGTKLKCKSCHVGNLGTPDWHAKVIGQSEQIPKHAVGVKGSASF